MDVTFFVILVAGIFVVAGSMALSHNQGRAERARMLLKASMSALPKLTNGREVTIVDGPFTFVLRKDKRRLKVKVDGNFICAFEKCAIEHGPPPALERHLTDPQIQRAFNRLQARRDLLTMECSHAVLQADFQITFKAERIASILQALLSFCQVITHSELPPGASQRGQLSAPSGAPLGVPLD